MSRPPHPSAGADDQGVHGLLARYQQAMQSFSADELSALYADDAVHEFGFFTPGHAPRYVGPGQVRAAYAAAWAQPAVELTDLRNMAVHETADPACVVSEWSATARRRDDGTRFPIAGVLVLTARAGLLVHVRDYMDVLGLALHTGRLQALATRLSEIVA
ncbi:MAG: nuclear transport factor 2 family protein [Blastococcus sp.]